MNIAKRLKAGIAAHQKGRLVVAEDAYRDVLRAEPENPDALHLFGMLLFHQGEHDKGIAAVRKSLSFNGVNAAAHCTLGNMLLTVEKPNEAVEAYQAALGVDPLHTETYRNFGVLLRRVGRLSDAIETLEQASELDPKNSEVWHNLAVSYIEASQSEKAADALERCLEQGWNPQVSAVWHARLLCAMGREQAALVHLEKYLKKYPDDPVAVHHVKSIRGETMDKVPEDYVREHFNAFSRTFDDVLGSLNYRAPQLVGEQVDSWRGDRTPAPYVLDLGCGTGLCGPLIAKHCEKLVGVDLSPKMLQKAADLNAYHELYEDELVRFMEQLDEGSVGFAISADTLNYLGNLAPFMEQVARTLTPGGVLIATFEEGDDEVPETGYRLQSHGRYCHARSYLDETIENAGLQVHTSREAILRREAGDDVSGLILTIERPAT